MNDLRNELMTNWAQSTVDFALEQARKSGTCPIEAMDCLILQSRETIHWAEDARKSLEKEQQK
ncbi:MAG: hypothetical protein R8G60_11155 [Roseovarius pacificus]|nr:hypothetical protein [Roseovarius pacificus]